MIDAVIKLGGRCLEEPAVLSRLASEISQLVQDGRWISVVHGGGVFLDQHLAARGLQSEKKQGIRITTPEMIEEIVAVLGGTVNKKLVVTLKEAKVKAVGLCGADGNTANGQVLKFPDFDPGRVGRVVSGDAQLLHNLTARGFVPVLAPLATDSQGKFLNINADSFAAGIARIAAAKQLILLTDVPGILDGKKKLIAQTDAAEVEQLIADGTIHGGMIPKVRAALEASKEAGCDVRIANWEEPGILTRIFASEPVGTTISSSRKPISLVR